ncbi:MAG: L-fucose/L-arabinose isomerase family protein [Bacteroidales bacterium]|nr:L-fucose/L-arabinose isomerase family protein [Bacteroidales bacterium]
MKARIAFLYTGLNTYWAQFEGLKDHLDGYAGQIISHLGADGGVEVSNLGLIDSAQTASAAASALRNFGADLLFIYVSTYCLSSTVLPVAKAAGCPCILLNLQPDARIDYTRINSTTGRAGRTGMWLEFCQACSIPEIAGVFNRSGIRYDIVTGHLREDSCWRQIEEWVQAAKVLRGMRSTRLGILGHYYCGMLDVYTDLLGQSSTFGTEIKLLEMDELHELRDSVTDGEIQSKIQEFDSSFEVSPECDREELVRAARTACALDKLVAIHGLGAMAYYYEGTAGSEHEDIVTSVIAGNTLLTGSGIPVAGECEVKNAQAMKILSLFGAGGSFSEFYAMDFDDDVVLLGHDGPAHHLMSEGKVALVPLPVFHGKPGRGLSIQMTVRSADVTLLSVCEDAEGVFLLVAEGRSVPGEILEIGNTNSRYSFECGARSFIDRWSKAGPSHHCAIGIGHLAGRLAKFASLAGIRMVTVR